MRSEKNDIERGQAPTSQARSRDTDHLRPSNLAARILSWWSIHSPKIGHDPCSEWRGLVAAVKSDMREKHVFYRVGSEHK